MKSLLPALLLIVALTGCDQASSPSSADAIQTKATNAAMQEASRQVGMPNIVNFTELKLAKMISELRDTEGYSTWTYIVDLNGNLHLLTESIGYGLPYSVQMTNPEKIVSNSRTVHSYNNLPQAEPNGLFMPGGLSATWIMAVTPEGPVPMYVEPQIVVSPFKLAHVE